MDAEAREQMRAKIRLLEDEVHSLRSEIDRKAFGHSGTFSSRSPGPVEGVAADLTNDFNNVLQSILGHVQLAKLKNKGDCAFREMFDEIERIVHRGSQLTHKYLNTDQKKQFGLLPLDLNRKMQEIGQLLERTIPGMIDIEFDLDRDLKKVNAEDREIEQLLMNLAINANSAMPDGGKLLFKTENVILKADHPLAPMRLFPGDYVLVTLSGIRPVGSSVPDKELAGVAEKAEEESDRASIDLSLVNDIAKNQGGYIDYFPLEDRSITYNLYLPAYPEYAVSSHSIENQTQP